MDEDSFGFKYPDIVIVFGMALKTNDSLAFAILTGCLRITKESIFMGLNNFKVLSILDPRFDEQFGFTDYEVEKNFGRLWSGIAF